MERSGRVFFRRGRSMDKSLNCSRFVTTSPQLHQRGKRVSGVAIMLGYKTCLLDKCEKSRRKLALTLCTVSCAGPQTPCLLPQDRCRCETCPPRRLAPPWMPTASFPGRLRLRGRSMMMKGTITKGTRHLHSSSSCSFSPRRPSAGPNTD